MRILNGLLCLVSLFIAPQCNRLLADELPNIVFILADDLGIGDVKCYGGDRCQIETPNIDQMAKDGVRFTDAHVNASVCQPTRVAIMTGRYPWRFGASERGGPWGYVGPRMPESTFTIADLLRQVGYQCGYVGKWHLGTRMQTFDGKVQGETNVDFTKPLTYGPPELGFDDSFILPGSLDMFPYAYARNNVWQGNVTARKGWSAFNRVGAAEENFEDHEVVETFYQEAEAFVAKQNSDKPFFLYVALTAPHTPTSPGVAWRGKSKLGVYGDFVMEVDHAVERIRDALTEHDFDKNTLVLFSSDHGAAPYAGNILKATKGQIRLLEEQGHYSSGPYRGYKFSLYEGGLRVPLVACGAGVARNATCDQLVGLCDLMATFASLTGQKLTPVQGVDSISFAPLLANPNAKGRRTELVMQSVGPFAVREGIWKLCLCPGSGSTLDFGNEPKQEEAWRDAFDRFESKPSRRDIERAPFVQLYNLDSDPEEAVNLAGTHPERVERMLERLRDMVANGRSTPGPKIENGSRNVNLFPRLPEFVKRALIHE